MTACPAIAECQADRFAEQARQALWAEGASEINDLSDASVLLGHSKEWYHRARLPTRRRQRQAF